MRKIIKKLHISEKLILVAYLTAIASFILPDEDSRATVIFLCFLGATALAIWSMLHLKKASFTLWPLYLSLAVALGLLLGSLGGASGPAAAIGMFLAMFFTVLISINLVCCFIFATKDIVKILALIVLSFAMTLALDAAFITSNEIGERGCGYAKSKHADWRVLCE